MHLAHSSHFPSRVVALSGALVLLGLTRGESSAALPEQEDALDSQLVARCERAVESGQLGGLVVVIQVGETIVLERGWGRLSGSELAEPTSLFRAEALVDPLVAWTAMRLYEAGRLSDESTIDGILPSVFPKDTWGARPVQVGQLMNQTSGLMGWASSPTGKGEGKETAQALLERVSKLGLQSEPGACFEYSESNALVLGALVEKVSGIPLATAVQAQVLGRAGLESTGWSLEGAPDENGDFGASREIAGQLVESPEGVHPFAEDEFCSTAQDVGMLVSALGRGDIVGPTALREMLTRQVLNGGAPIGMGYGVNFASIDEIQGFSIGGCAEGTTIHSAYYAAPDVTVTCLAAAPEAAMIPLERDLARLVLGLSLPGTARVLLPPEEALMLVGRYQVGCTTLEVAAQKDGTLTLATAGAADRQLNYRGAQQFVDATDPDARFEFVIPDDGKYATVIRISDHGRYSEAVRTQ